MAAAARKTTPAMSEDRMVDLVRNALLVAGHEMGEEGDHWPVVKSTIHSIMKDWEDLKIERNVSAELRAYLDHIIGNAENNLHLCPDHQRSEAEKIVKEMRDIYHACFEEVTEQTMYVICDADVPIHVMRMQEIISTLEDNHAGI